MLYVWLFIAGFITWTISTLSGGGGAMTLVPILSFLLGAQAAAPVVTMGMVVGSLGRLAIFRKSIEWRIVAWALPAAIAGAALGGFLFSILPVDWLQLALGFFLLSTVAQEYFARSKAHFDVPPWIFAPVYFLVASLSAVMGAVGPVMNVLFLNAGILKEHGCHQNGHFPAYAADQIGQLFYLWRSRAGLYCGGNCGRPWRQPV